MKTRRGLSTVVGMVFAIIAITTTVAYVSYSMNTLNQYNNAVIVKNQGLSDASKENFKITNVGVVNSKLNITLANTGSVPINFTKIWIQNTTTTNWVHSYSPVNSFASTGATLTNLGQKIPLSINSAYSYNVKLVTSRGNNQAFSINSANAAPLNIQLLTLPSTVPGGLKTELVMIVINNGSSTLVNIVPNTPSNNDTTDCSLGTVSPSSFTTLVPGSTAVFKWDVGTSAQVTSGTTCMFSLTQPLQNGYSQSLNAKVSIQAISLSSTTYASNSGVITNDYTAFRWIQGNTWTTDWSFPSCTTTDFKITIENNNQTAGGYSLWLSKNSQLFFVPTVLTNIPNNKMAPQTYYLVSAVTTNPLGITQYTDNSIGVPNQGGIVTLYFGASSPGGSTQAASTCSNNYPYGLSPNTPYYGSIIIYGKFTKNSGDTNGGNYAQTIPFLAIISN